MPVLYVKPDGRASGAIWYNSPLDGPPLVFPSLQGCLAPTRRGESKRPQPIGRDSVAGEPTGFLHELKVLDLTHYVAGPYAKAT